MNSDSRDIVYDTSAEKDSSAKRAYDGAAGKVLFFLQRRENHLYFRVSKSNMNCRFGVQI